MKYKKDPWYIAGLIVTVVSVAVMSVTMVMMYYGNNTAIVVCFSAMPFLAIGILMAQSTKRRYEEADATDGKPLPMFWQIRFAFHNLKIYLRTSRIWRGLFAGLCALFVSVAVILSGFCAYWSCKGSKIESSTRYTESVTQYDTYYSEWQKARKDGDEITQTKAFNKMQEADQIKKTYLSEINKCNTDIKFTWPWIAFFVACAVFCGTMLYVYGIRNRIDL